MLMQDNIIIVINLLCTVFSVIGVLKSYANYKKSMQLTYYVTLHKALEECQKVQDIVNNKFLKLCSGKNCKTLSQSTEIINDLKECGNSMESSLSKIRTILPLDSNIVINEIIMSKGRNIEKYFNSMISGSAFENNDVTEERAYEIQSLFNAIQLHIKEKAESIQKSEKKI